MEGKKGTGGERRRERKTDVTKNIREERQRGKTKRAGSRLVRKTGGKKSKEKKDRWREREWRKAEEKIQTSEAEEHRKRWCSPSLSFSKSVFSYLTYHHKNCQDSSILFLRQKIPAPSTLLSIFSPFFLLPVFTFSVRFLSLSVFFVVCVLLCVFSLYLSIPLLHSSHLRFSPVPFSTLLSLPLSFPSHIFLPFCFSSHLSFSPLLFFPSGFSPFRLSL